MNFSSFMFKFLRISFERASKSPIATTCLNCTSIDLKKEWILSKFSKSFSVITPIPEFSFLKVNSYIPGAFFIAE